MEKKNDWYNTVKNYKDYIVNVFDVPKDRYYKLMNTYESLVK